MSDALNPFQPPATPAEVVKPLKKGWRIGLLELLVVVTIVGVLVAMLIPAR